MNDVQSLLDHALSEYDKADNEVERLLDIIDKATIALEEARESKRTAKIKLDEAIASVFRVPENLSVAVEESKDSSYSEGYSSEEESSQSCSSGASEEDGDDDEEEENDSHGSAASVEEEDRLDIADEALERIRYRLNDAKVDPNSTQGVSLLDELLMRLKNTTVSDGLIDEIMDDLLHNPEGSFEEEYSTIENEDYESEEEEEHYESEEEHSYEEQYRIEISRGGKHLGFYEGCLDERGYAREGQGTMHYNAGHTYSGNWKDDEMDGHGVYRWSDGHVYEGEWLKGKRHGLGCFIRPDGVVLFGRYEEGRHVGEGIRWSADRSEAQIVANGVPHGKIDIKEAFKMKKELGFDEDEFPCIDN